VAAGKAAPEMAVSALRALGSAVRGGVVVARNGANVPAPFESVYGHHPVPDENSERAGRRVLELVSTVPAGDRLLVLLSGGASAMMAVPAGELTLGDKQATTSQLLRAGADIYSLNAVRKHLSAIKGGQLAAAAGESITLAISDVVGDDLSAIGSGPTVPDATTFQEALDVIRRHGGEEAYPSRVVGRLQQGAGGLLPETPKLGDPRLLRASAHVIGSRANAMDGAAQAAIDRGYHVKQIDQPVTGEAREAARRWLDDVLAHASTMGRPACIVTSGETTVQVKGNGRGGRNQEFALALVDLLAASDEKGMVAASIGTDGVDGPTDAAGAIVDSGTFERARRAGLPPARTFLNNNNSYELFAPLGDLVLTGPTATNVGDIQILLLV
jgi:glycerate-2-kinase